MPKTTTTKRSTRKTKTEKPVISVKQERRAEQRTNWRPSIGSPTYEREG